MKAERTLLRTHFEAHFLKTSIPGLSPTEIVIW
jgi:hypothetical protein